MVEGFSCEIVPKKHGIFSKQNIDGKGIVRKDLPKESRSFDFLAYGEHPSSYSKDCYVRETLYRKQTKVSFKVYKVDGEYIHAIISINLDSDEDEKDIVFKINLLKEVSDEYYSIILSSEESIVIENTFYLNWEIFPKGTSIEKIIKGSAKDNKSITQEEIKERFGELSKYEHEKIIKGRKGLKGYFGFLFKNNIVAFDNYKNGNALFLIEDSNWEELSKKTKAKLNSYHNVKRIIHRKGWKKELEDFLNEKLESV